MVQDLKKENFDLKLRLYMEQKQNEVLFLRLLSFSTFLIDNGCVLFSFIKNIFIFKTHTTMIENKWKDAVNLS